MTAGLFTPIPAPRNGQATTGLIALATAATGVPAEWEAGFSFDPESCSPGQALAIECGASEAKTDSAHPGIVQYAPFAAVVVDSCTTLDQGRDGVGIAQRLLLSRQSAILEGVFWTGDAVGDTPNDGTLRPHLADGRATVLAGGTAVALVHGLALIDQALTACLGGQIGMLHVAPYTLARLVAEDILSLEGGRWYTPNRHLVVSGAGYTGGGPRPTVGGALPAAPTLTANPATDQWIYATAQVFYLLGAASEPLREVNRAVNNVDVITERPAAAFHGCCQYAIQLDTSTT